MCNFDCNHYSLLLVHGTGQTPVRKLLFQEEHPEVHAPAHDPHGAHKLQNE
jgi:hypothetical protein